MSRPERKTVTTRQVFYIPGYDPIPPRRYREVYRTESAKQARISGYQIGIRARQGDGPFGWHVDAQIDGTTVTSDMTVLAWADIVQGSMTSSIPGTYLQLLRTAWIYIGSGALWRLMRLRKGPVIAALYPVAVLLAQLLIAVVAFFVLWWLGAALAPGIGTYVGAALGAASFVLILRWFKSKDGKVFAYYLMHDFSYSAAWNGAYADALEGRLATFADMIAEALASDVDEVLVVGHSSGAHLAVSILADLIRARRVPKDGPALGFLSLGQVVPMVAFLPDAHRLRADLRFLSRSDRLAWVDVTAPGDGTSKTRLPHACFMPFAPTSAANRS